VIIFEVLILKDISLIDIINIERIYSLANIKYVLHAAGIVVVSPQRGTSEDYERIARCFSSSRNSF